MYKPQLYALGCAAMLGAPLTILAADPATEAEIQQLKDRLQTLEQRQQQPVASVASAASANAYNPKLSLILDGSYANFSSTAPAVIPGFLLGGEPGFRPQGLSLGESELVMEANIDQSFHGWTTLSLAPSGGVDVEEAFINTLGLPAGLALKFGRFKSDIGYQNHQHAHAWEFVDAPLPYRAMLGTQLGDDGLQLRWLAPTDLFLEFGTELLRGAAFPAGGEIRKGIKAYTGFVHVGGDVGSGGAWRLGLSQLRADADRRRSGEDTPTEFTGKSRLTIVDAIYKWAPDGNPAITSFVAQAEYFHRNEDGTVVYDPSASADTSRYQGHQSGWYVQGVYQFMPRWRSGLRYDRLGSANRLDNPAPGTTLATLAGDGSAPQRWSLMTDFSNSEFSRIRLQYNRDQSRPAGQTDHQLFLQYIFSLGSHPAHQF